MRNKKAQMQISFGMIVSIILIIVFLSVAFYAISKFLSLQRAVQVGNFVNNLQFNIDKIWKSSQGAQEINLVLPKKISDVCFIDYNSPAIGKDKEKYEELRVSFFEYENLIFYPIGSGEGLDANVIQHINIENITKTHNPYCLENNGKVKISLSMDFGENLVMIK